MHRASESRDMNNSGGRVRYIPWKTLKVTDSQIIDQIISNSACAVFCEHWHTRHNLWWLGRAQILLRPCRFIITILCMLFMSIVIHITSRFVCRPICNLTLSRTILSDSASITYHQQWTFLFFITMKAHSQLCLCFPHLQMRFLQTWTCCSFTEQFQRITFVDATFNTA